MESLLNGLKDLINKVESEARHSEAQKGEAKTPPSPREIPEPNFKPITNDKQQLKHYCGDYHQACHQRIELNTRLGKQIRDSCAGTDPKFAFVVTQEKDIKLDNRYEDEVDFIPKKYNSVQNYHLVVIPLKENYDIMYDVTHNRCPQKDLLSKCKHARLFFGSYLYYVDLKEVLDCVSFVYSAIDKNITKFVAENRKADKVDTIKVDYSKLRVETGFGGETVWCSRPYPEKLSRHEKDTPSPSEIPKPNFKPIKIKECDTGKQIVKRKVKVNAFEIQRKENKKTTEQLKYRNEVQGDVYVSYVVEINDGYVTNSSKYHLLKVPFNKESYDVITKSFDSIMPALVSVKGSYYCMNCNPNHKLFHTSSITFAKEQEFSGLPGLIKEMDSNYCSLERIKVIQHEFNSANNPELELCLIAKHKGVRKVNDTTVYETNSLGEQNYFLVEIPIVQKNYDELINLCTSLNIIITLGSKRDETAFKDLTQVSKTWKHLFLLKDGWKKYTSGFINPLFSHQQRETLLRFIDFLNEKKQNDDELETVDLNSTVETNTIATDRSVTNSVATMGDFVDLGQRSESEKEHWTKEEVIEQVNGRNIDCALRRQASYGVLLNTNWCILTIPLDCEYNKVLVRRLYKDSKYIVRYDQFLAATVQTKNKDWDAFKINEEDQVINYLFHDSNQQYIDDANQIIHRYYEV